MRCIVLGSNGWLGARYAEHFKAQGWKVHRSVTDIVDYQQLSCEFTSCDPALAINAAGRTHSHRTPNIDACVTSQRARRETLRSNAIGAGIVATLCAERSIKLVHLSSGCIFEGPGTFDEYATPNPVSWYAETKVIGERLVLAANPRAAVLRIRMPIDSRPHPRNLITKLAAAKQVVDVLNSVTVVDDLLTLTDEVVNADIASVVHAVHRDPITYRELTGWMRELVDPAIDPTFIPASEYQTLDGRSNCVLAITRPGVPTMRRPVINAVRDTLAKYALEMVSG
jgi:dTDP-4-dehydrorhamnose reductase